MSIDSISRVDSEIGKLQRVMVHRPGIELERLTGENKESFLFDDLLWVQKAQQEHDKFVAELRNNKIEVVYFKDLLSDLLQEKFLKVRLVDEVLKKEELDQNLFDKLFQLMTGLDPTDLANIFLGGITKRELFKYETICTRSLLLKKLSDDDFIIPPVPNIYFQRDPCIIIQDMLIPSRMRYKVRQRESILVRYLINHHKMFDQYRKFDIKASYILPDSITIEGGDVMILSENTIAIGISQRTSTTAIQLLGQILSRNSSIKQILAINIPKSRAMMHLDTVFAMIDNDTFAIFSDIIHNSETWLLEFDHSGELTDIHEFDNIHKGLENLLNRKVFFLPGLDTIDPVTESREQWTDGPNILTMSPGSIFSYDRNIQTNENLERSGITVYRVSGCELGRGRGGPRCMVMPLSRICN